MINKKAQSLTELAVFGSILLLVLSFLISYGMRYNYQQDVQMRAFRKAMSEAYKYADRPDATVSITLIEDKHVPDPRDRFGLGSVIPMQAGAQVTWGNTMQNEYAGGTDFSRMKYVINGAPKEYTTEGLITISDAVYSGFYADILGSRQYVVWADVTCYQPTPDSPKQALVLLADNDTEIVNAIYLPFLDSAVGPSSKIEEISLPIVGVVPSDAKNGDKIHGFSIRTPRGGQINPYYTQLNQKTGEFDAFENPIYVTPENMQGLLPFDTITNTTRKDYLNLKETSGTSGYRESTASYNLNATITRKIRENSGSPDVILPPDTVTSPPVIIKSPDTVKPWQTPKK